MSVTELLSWLAFGAAAFSAVQMWIADHQMQQFRHPAEQSARYWLVPIRWQEDLYLPQGQPMVRKAWQALGRTAGFFFLAAILLMFR